MFKVLLDSPLSLKRDEEGPTDTMDPWVVHVYADPSKGLKLSVWAQQPLEEDGDSDRMISDSDDDAPVSPLSDPPNPAPFVPHEGCVAIFFLFPPSLTASIQIPTFICHVKWIVTLTFLISV